MDTIQKSCQDMQNKQIFMQDTILEKLSSFKELLEQKKQSLTTDDNNLEQSMIDIKEAAKKLQFQKPQKEFETCLKKLNKDLERKFKQDISLIYHPEAFTGKENLIIRALALHFIRQGKFELCDEFMDEAQVPIDDELRATVEHLKAEFEQMYNVLNQLEKENDLSSAIKWTEEHHDGLQKLGSSLEFNLHRMKFIQLLLGGNALEAINYGRQHFHNFGEKNYPEIKRLMTAPLYINDISTSRYADLCSPSNWTEIKQQFQRDFCSLLKMSSESPLYTSVYVGTTALPVIMKLFTIMASKKTEWSAQDELPVEIPLDEELRYHSVFACPVSKEQTTDENPPMMMPCGHVIYLNARIARQNHP
ncbi:hypothetical protein [Parasitella parasitica]|uniref:CTLH domain-containing protein n=1 Tax=Parasitella parasitica TaxID=35722 RepID=A0A0B7NWR9_9FUNG|nr:hypothetical protein [Parasitella parasitica]